MANRFVAEYGVVRLSIGEAVRKVLNLQPYTELARQINLHLKAGNPVPDELAVQALEVALLDMQCQTRGYGYIMSCNQIGKVLKNLTRENCCSAANARTYFKREDLK